MITFLNELEWNPSSLCNTFPGLLSSRLPIQRMELQRSRGSATGSAGNMWSSFIICVTKETGVLPWGVPEEVWAVGLCYVLPFGEFITASSELTSEQKGSIGKK